MGFKRTIFVLFILFSLLSEVAEALDCNDYFRLTTRPSIPESLIIQNSKLSDADRLQETFKAIGRKNLSSAEEAKLAATLKAAHQSGGDKGVFEYSWRELREKNRILVEGGFTPQEADVILRLGFAGRPPSRELIQPGRTLFSGFAKDIATRNYVEKRAKFLDLLQEKYPNQAQAIADNIESLYFIDYSHSSGKLGKILADGQKIEALPLSSIYSKEAFNNFKEARNYLLTNRPELNKTTLLKIQSMMMKGGVDGIDQASLGKIRREIVYGMVEEAEAIDQLAISEMATNPYLMWNPLGETDQGKFYGEIYYPTPQYVKKEALDLIRSKQPALVGEVEEFQRLIKQIESGTQDQAVIRRYNQLIGVYERMNERLVNSLVDDLMDWFTRQRTIIGDIDSPEKLDQFVDLLAVFQRHLISIHPATDGNGRTVREFISYALMKEGLPPPRIINPDADLYSNLNDWKKILKHGILTSDFLMEDMAQRLEFGLPMENSLELIAPYTRPPIRMALKGDRTADMMEGVEYVDPRLYREIIKRLFKEKPTLKNEILEDPIKAWDKIHKKAEEVFKRNNIYYNHARNGIERVEIGYVDDDFKLLYGKTSYKNQKLFDFKMKTWYTNQIVWRGLANQEHVVSEREILLMFKQMSDHFASNSVLNEIAERSTPDLIRKAALKDFEKYNEDVFGDGLVKMAKDHSETGPLYEVSYGYSTSKDRKVGKAFAMGAMVIADYGQQRNVQLQQLLKSRVLVGAKKAYKDVDLTRLKQLREDFSYRYGRQQEVMGIGAADPDSISIVQTIDDHGEVILSYLRNPKKANEIWVIQGDIDPNVRPEAGQVIKTINLGQ